LCSYTETEQHEEAVRDYEKVCKMDKSRGKCIIIVVINLFKNTSI